MKLRISFCLIFVHFLFSSVCFLTPANAQMTLKNADFQQFYVEKESPTDWNGDEFCRCEPVVREDGTRGGVKITIVKEFQNHISVNQLIPVPETPKEWFCWASLRRKRPASVIYRSNFSKIDGKFAAKVPVRTVEDPRRFNCRSRRKAPTPF